MKIGIYGCGVMGQGIARMLCTDEHVEEIVWCARSSDSLVNAKEKISSKLHLVAKRRKYTDDDIFEILNKIILTDDLGDFCGCDLVVEAVSEVIDTKKHILSEISLNVAESCVIASNTSSLSITELSSYVEQPDKFLGMHFFNPADTMKLVEIIPGARTSDKTVSFSSKFVLNLNKTPVVLNETPGFIVNRLIMPMINEAITLYAERCADISEIDSAMKLGARHPMGPLELADFIGLDVVLSILETLQRQTGDDKYRPHYELRKMVWSGRLGCKVGEGFYTYD